MITEAHSVILLLWKVMEAAQQAYNNRNRCMKFRARLDALMPKFSDAIDKIGPSDASYLIERLLEFAEDSLAFLKRFEKKSFFGSFPWRMLFSKSDNDKFDSLFKNMDQLQLDIHFFLMIETHSFLVTHEYKKDCITALKNDLFLHKELLTNASKASPPISKQDLCIVAQNIQEFTADVARREETVELEPVMKAMCSEVLHSIIPELQKTAPAAVETPAVVLTPTGVLDPSDESSLFFVTKANAIGIYVGTVLKSEGSEHFQGNGTFTFNWNKCGEYVGDWVGGKREGYGKQTLADGDTYEGYFLNDAYHGTGVYISANGDRYEGEFKGNERVGGGIQFFADGTHMKCIYNAEGVRSGEYFQHKVAVTCVIIKGNWDACSWHSTIYS